MHDAEGPESTRMGRVLLGAALLLAVGATGMLILADDVKWLRLGIVAALWAALVGAFVAAKFRRQVVDREDEMADRQAVYELELEREVAARREFELEVEAEARRKTESESHTDISALRQEVLALRQSLEALLGGEVLVERVALHAESTRMRSLTESSQPLTDSRPLTVRQSGVRRITAAQSDRETELIDRVHVARQSARQAAPTRPAPRRPEPSRSFANEGSERWFAGAQGAGRPEDLPETINAERSPSWEVQAGPANRIPGRRTAEADPPSRRRMDRVEPVAEQAPGRRAAAETGGYRPVGERTTPTGSFPVTSTQTSGYRPDPSAYRPTPPPSQPPTQSSISHRLTETTGSHQPVPPVRRAEQTGNAAYRAAAEQFVTERSGYASALEQSASYAGPSGGRPVTGHHAVPDAPTGSHAAGGRRRAEEPPVGSHASGTSVSELLAAHGQDASPRRRRRRDED